MDFYELPFAKILFISDDIAEVIMNDSIEIDAHMVEQLHNVLLFHLQAPFSLLVNKVNSYAYDFPAQKKVATLQEINAIAVVAYSQTAIITTQSVASISPEHEWNMKIFSNRSDALVWLLSEQDKSNNHINNGVVVQA